MSDRTATGLFLAIVAGVVYLGLQAASAPELPAPAPVCPGPDCPVPKPKPRRPWGSEDQALVSASVGGRTAPDGKTEIQCDLPGPEHMRNTGGMGPRGPGTGAGLCVFTSIEHSAKYQNVPELLGFQKWMTHKPGGGHPQKVDAMIAEYCKSRGLQVPAYVQVRAGGQEILDLLQLACKCGRMPGVTYSRSPTGRYGGRQIAHMVSLPHADPNFYAVLDNNHPGDSAYEWMTPQEFLRICNGGGTVWAWIALNPSPPPVPRR